MRDNGGGGRQWTMLMDQQALTSYRRRPGMPHAHAYTVGGYSRQFSRGGCLCWSLVADGAVASFVVHSMVLIVVLHVMQLPSDASVSSEARPLIHCESRGSLLCC